MATQVYYAIYGPEFEGIVTSLNEYKHKVNGRKKTFGKRCKNKQAALQWIENKKKSVQGKMIAQPVSNLSVQQKAQIYYAIYRPDQQLIVTTQKRYKKETKGHTNAHGKKFNSKNDAELWLKQMEQANKVEPIVEKQKIVKQILDQQAVIYIDGSFKDNIGKYAFVVFSSKSTTKLFQDFGFVYDENFNSLMNVGAEMMACLRALEWAFSNNIKDVHLIYDYEGIITHTSNNTDNVAIQIYQKMMKAFHKHLQLHFLHVRHANKEFHNLAHKLTQLSL